MVTLDSQLAIEGRSLAQSGARAPSRIKAVRVKRRDNYVDKHRLADHKTPTALDWAAAMRGAADAIGELGGAKPGDRTMLDALVPAVDAFERELKSGYDANKAWAAAVSAAESGASDTAHMAPRAGRASYLGARAIGSPDGGAVAIACWLKALQPYIAAR
ncbi:DAK2 domain-containing protein [Paraburkholderia sp. T12-10]|nr:DAK2 domain-containing protein [Paraburkholderia sp. T12-10]